MCIIKLYPPYPALHRPASARSGFSGVLKSANARGSAIAITDRHHFSEWMKNGGVYGAKELAKALIFFVTFFDQAKKVSTTKYYFILNLKPEAKTIPLRAFLLSSPIHSPPFNPPSL